MGMLDFAKDVGRKLFRGKDDAALRIREELVQSGLGLRDLDVRYDDGKVTLSGRAPSAAALQKAVLIAGNVEGVARVDIDTFRVDQPGGGGTSDTASRPAGSSAEEVVTYYEIRKGDTLSGIALRFYGDAGEYPRLFEANREVIKDPDRIFPGQKIRIPGARQGRV